MISSYKKQLTHICRVQQGYSFWKPSSFQMRNIHKTHFWEQHVIWSTFTALRIQICVWCPIIIISKLRFYIIQNIATCYLKPHSSVRYSSQYKKMRNFFLRIMLFHHGNRMSLMCLQACNLLSEAHP